MAIPVGTWNLITDLHSSTLTITSVTQGTIAGTQTSVPAVDAVGNPDAIQHPPKGSRRARRVLNGCKYTAQNSLNRNL
jgi:hypothetical protein